MSDSIITNSIQHPFLRTYAHQGSPNATNTCAKTCKSNVNTSHFNSTMLHQMPQTNLLWKNSRFHFPAWLVGWQPFVNPDRRNDQKVTYPHIVCSNRWKNFLQWSRSRTFARQGRFCWALSATATWVSSFWKVSECWNPQHKLMIAWTIRDSTVAK